MNHLHYFWPQFEALQLTLGVNLGLNAVCDRNLSTPVNRLHPLDFGLRSVELLRRNFDVLLLHLVQSVDHFGQVPRHGEASIITA